MRIAALALVALMAGCSGAESNDTNTDGVDDAAVPTNVIEVPPSETAPPPLDTMMSNGSAPADEPTATEAGTLPPAGAEYRYAGRWAATEQLCDTGAWRFQPKRLDTAGEVSCTFDKVEKVAGGYDIAASCLAEGTRSADTIALRFAESAQAMLVQSTMWDGVGLIYCGAAE
jgi:hypothetical protein